MLSGPPTEPAGVYVESNAGENGTVHLVWTWNPTANHGFPVTFFDIEAKTEFSREWTPLATGL